MSTFRNNLTKLASGAGIAQLIALISSPIITRLYSPDDYGIFGVYIALSTIFIMISTGRYHQAIVLPKSQIQAINLVILSLFLTLATSIICLPLIYFFGSTITKLLNAPKLSIFLWLIPISILIRGVLITLECWHTRIKNFGFISISNITESFTGSLSGILLGIILGSSSFYLIISRILSTTFSVSILAFNSVLSAFKQYSAFISVRKIKYSAIRYIKFPLISTWSALLNTVAYMGPLLLLSAFFNPVVVGFYTIADRVIITPLTIIGNALSQLVYQKSSEIKNSSLAQENLVIKISNLLFSVSYFPTILLAIYGEYIFSVMFGDSWSDAGKYAQILSLYAFSRFITSPLANICLVHNKHEIELYFNIALSILRLSSIIIGGLYNNILLGLFILSFTTSLAYLALLMTIYKISNCSVIGYLKNCRKTVMYFLPLTLLAAYVNYNLSSLYILIFLFISIPLYVWVLYFIDRSVFSFLHKTPN